MAQPLANKYRPQTFEDVTEQIAVKTIIKNQIKENDLRSAYLFCGGAGTGKTTSGRIVANKINEGKGNPIELDAASNNSVEDVRRIILDTKYKSMDSKYKIYIIDECHALSSQAWQAMLKLLEETPQGVIFIFCTTDPHKIPGTILSRVQRFNFQRISTQGILNRLEYICSQENIKYEKEALIYIAKNAQGGMRDAITSLDKCIAFNKEVTLSSVVEVLSSGVTPYQMSEFTQMLKNKDMAKAMFRLNDFFMSGIDMGLFMNMYFEFLLNLQKYLVLHNENITNLPSEILKDYTHEDNELVRTYLQKLYVLINAQKVDTKTMLEAWVIERCM